MRMEKKQMEHTMEYKKEHDMETGKLERWMD